MLRAVLGIGLVSAIFVMSPERTSSPSFPGRAESAHRDRAHPFGKIEVAQPRVEAAATDLAMRLVAGRAMETVRTIVTAPPPPIQVDMPPLRR